MKWKQNLHTDLRIWVWGSQQEDR